MTLKLTVRSYDVWGNPKEGYTVNDTYTDCDDLFIAEEIWLNESSLKRLCKKEFALKRNIRLSSISIEGDDKYSTFTYDPTGYPIGEFIVTKRIEEEGEKK